MEKQKLNYKIISSKDTRYYNEINSKFILSHCVEEKRLDFRTIYDYCATTINIALFSLKLQSNTYKNMYNELSKIKNYKHIDKNNKKLIFELINYNQRIKFLLYKFFLKIKFKIQCRKKSVNDLTLRLQKIDTLEDKKTIKLYSNNNIFTFDAKEIAMNIENSLLNNEYMFPVPLVPKNPYNNVKLKVSELSSIYDCLIASRTTIPICFNMYKKCNFNLKKFKILFSNYLIDYATKEYIFNMTDCQLINSSIEEIIYISDEEGWRNKLPPSFPRFDTFCVECFKKWINSDKDNIELLKNILYKIYSNQNLKTFKKINIVKKIGIDSKESEYYYFWNENHKKHMFTPKKIKKDRENLESFYDTITRWIDIGEENFGGYSQQSSQLSLENF